MRTLRGCAPAVNSAAVQRLRVGLAESDDDRAAVYAIRREVFVREQGVPLEIELDEADATADHFLARDARGAAVGAGRLVTDGDTGVLGRLAVIARMRGCGAGVALVTAIEARAALCGLAAVELHAQVHATGFYERLGYQGDGVVFTEAGIEHVTMRKPMVPRRARPV